MNKVPPVISGKDLMYLEDMLNWNMTLSKKATHYSNEASDPKIKETLVSLAAVCKAHYESFVSAFNIGGTNE